MNAAEEPESASDAIVMPFPAIPMAAGGSAISDSEPAVDDQAEHQGEGDDGDRRSAPQILVDTAMATYEFGVTTEGEPYAVPLQPPRIVRLLRGGRAGLRSELAREYRRRTGGIARQQALADALTTLEGEAQLADPVNLAVRVARCSSGAIWIDLGDTTGRAIKLDAAGWHIADDPPVLFRRTVLTGALPIPQPGGRIDPLWPLVNIIEADRPLLLAWLISLLFPEIPHPIASLMAEQGTGKTTAAKIISSLVDPCPVQVRKVPRDADAWVTAASGTWVVTLDNLSEISESFSDTLCRAVTGDGDVRRRLYSDGELAVFAFRRCVLLTGIDVGVFRGDLADRLLPLDLTPISPATRRLDADIEQEWRAAQPHILGALLDLAVEVLQTLPTLHTERLPRMADFARILMAVDDILGTDGLDRYTTRARSLATETLTDDPFVAAMSRTLSDAFEGTSAQLLLIVKHDESRNPKGWPSSARAVTTLLRRLGPVMRRSGWDVGDLGASNAANACRWRIEPPKR